MSRPTRTGALSSKTITFRISPEEDRDLERLRTMWGARNRSDTVRHALRRALLALDDTSRILWDRVGQIAELPLTDTEVIIPKDRLLALSREDLERSVLPAAVRLIQGQFEHHGWFMPECLDSVSATLASVRKKAETAPDYSGMGRAGVAFLKSRFSSFWYTKGGAAACVQRPIDLERVLRYRLGLNAKRETFDLCLRQVRHGFVVQRKTVSFFKPTVAAGICKKWLPAGIERPVVWDPSGGFGARMLGFRAMFPEGNYIANEPARQTFDDLSNLADELGGPTILSTTGSEKDSHQEPADASVDLVFTSPPYFDLERYFDEPGQCWRDYPTLPEWRERYVLPTLLRAHRVLKPNAKLVLNVNEKHRDLFVRTAQRAGFSLLEEEYLVLRADHFAKKRGEKGTKSEPILIFEKRGM